MGNSIFTKESLEALNSSNTDSKFVKAYNPKLIVGILAIVVLLAGALVWGLFGTLQTETTVVGTSLEEAEGKVLLFINESDLDEVKEGSKVNINGTVCTIESISQYPLRLVERESGYYEDPTSDDLNGVPDLYENYVLYYSQQPSGSWFYAAEANYDGECPDNFFTCTVISEESSPITKMIKGLFS